MERAGDPSGTRIIKPNATPIRSSDLRSMVGFSTGLCDLREPRKIDHHIACTTIDHPPYVSVVFWAPTKDQTKEKGRHPVPGGLPKPLRLSATPAAAWPGASMGGHGTKEQT